VRAAVIVCFLDEQAYLPALLESLAAQERRPDQLLLIDDGSGDASAELASQFVQSHPYAQLLSRPRRPPQRDRLVTAAELDAFCWGVEQLREPWDVVAKLDADLWLPPQTVAELLARLEADPQLGIAGAHLSVAGSDERVLRERCPEGHVHGATKFYRRECFELVFPLPVGLGWDTADEVAARMHGWHTESFAIAGGDAIHLRPIANHDGKLRGYRRSGAAAWAYGAPAWWIPMAAAARLADRPRVIGALNHLAGWLTAALHRNPRVNARQRAFFAREHRARLRAALARRASS
jgi:biofilm PGA synthesis N-glycosyltransferase PgaC